VNTGLLYDERFLRHKAPYEHPEHPGRLTAIWEHLGQEGLIQRSLRVAAREASREELLAIHTEGHVAEVESTARHAFVQLDPDTYTRRDSAQAALLAAGGLVDLVSAVLRGDIDNGFALLRPPGHHAEADRAMGFCLYNNVAIAARAAQRAGARRVAIVDWDLHHGNGTQNSFYGDPDVLYFSTHQYPFYPGTGAIEETGDGEARGRTVNVPWPGGQGDADYLAAIEQVLLPIERAFDSDLLLVSCGFDAAEGDPLGAMRISPAGYAQMTSRLRGLAGGRLVLALEGGYNLEAISASAGACLRVLLGETSPAIQPGPVSSAAERVLERVTAAQRPFWPGIL
jgi:histone deacetylase 6